MRRCMTYMTIGYEVFHRIFSTLRTKLDMMWDGSEFNPYPAPLATSSITLIDGVIEVT